MSQRRQTTRRLKLLAPAIPFLFALACSLEVEQLPENLLPVLGAIGIAPSAELAPLDSFTLSISAFDPNEDPLFFRWTVNTGDWADGESRDSVVVWVAPASFAEVDTVHFAVSVYDFDQNNAVGRSLDIPVEDRFGDLLVRVFDLEGQPASVRVGLVGGEIREVAAAEHLFEDLLWGNHAAFTVDTEHFYGRRNAETHPGSFLNFAGYPDTVFVHQDAVEVLDLVVAPKTLVLIPGVATVIEADTTHTQLTNLQSGIDHCALHGLDSLLIRAGNHSLPSQEVPGGTAALRLDEADLVLAPFPGEGPVLLDASQGGNDFGFYLAGRSGATRVEGIVMVDAAGSGAYLDGSSGTFVGCALAGFGGAAITLAGGAGDTLRLEDSWLLDARYGIAAAEGTVLATGTLIEDCDWYGLWLREGASATLEGLTVVDCALAGVFAQDAGAVSVSRCLLALNGRGFFTQSGPAPVSACNLFWLNSSGDYGGSAPGADDLLVDPLFCDPGARDWRLQAGSPALDAACGPIGALGACGEGRRFPEVSFR